MCVLGKQCHIIFIHNDMAGDHVMAQPFFLDPLKVTINNSRAGWAGLSGFAFQVFCCL